MKRPVLLLAAIVLAALALPHAAHAASPAASAMVAATTGATSTAAGGLNIDLSGGGLFTDKIMQIIALITVLSIAPSILIMMTSFVRIVVVLSLLRTAMGLQTSPPNSVIVSLSLFLTLFVMTPTLKDAYNQGIVPLVNNQITTEQAFDRAATPMKKFMLGHVRAADLKLSST